MKVLAIISGVLMGILGVCAMTMPFRVFLGIGWLVGALFVVYGAQTVAAALKKEKKDILSCVLGILVALLGIWITFSGFQRALTDIMVAYFVGFSLIFNSILRFVTTYQSFKAGEKKQAVIIGLCGILTLIGGIFSVGHPILTMFSIGYLIAASLLVQGISTVIVACVAKKN